VKFASTEFGSGFHIAGYCMGSYCDRTMSMEANDWERFGSIPAFRCGETACSTWGR
jgi:hypothetical protein